MKNTFGNQLTITLFGESHGTAIGAVIDGVPSGVKIDEELMKRMMEQRKAVGSISTARKEADLPHILSGVKNGYTEGTPIAICIENQNVRRQDYNALQNVARPGHADYAGHMKYLGYEDASGGGHFSGRITAPIVATGAICMHMLETKGIYVGTHITQLLNLKDRPYDEEHLLEDIQKVNQKTFAVLDDEMEEKMTSLIQDARSKQDSVGGILDTAIFGLEPGIGEPEFDSLESLISHAMFSIGGVKGIEFGDGFNFSTMYGSQANDAFRIKDGKVVTKTNHNGGINGGISNGMPIRFRLAVKPTPSIAQEQETVNFDTKQEQPITIVGRHDPAIIHRVRVVVDSLVAITLVNFLIERHGSLYFGDEK